MLFFEKNKKIQFILHTNYNVLHYTAVYIFKIFCIYCTNYIMLVTFYYTGETLSNFPFLLIKKKNKNNLTHKFFYIMNQEWNIIKVSFNKHVKNFSFL